jgi:Ca2+-binding RTX toxin-like protein
MVEIVKLGGEFLVNSQTTGFQEQPSITGLAGGGFVTTWTDYSAPSGLGVAKAQIWSAAGTKVGSEFFVAGGATTDQSFPTVTSLANGGFAVTWTETGIQSDYKIKAQVYSATGAVVAPAFLVNSTTWTQQGGNNLPGNHNPTITGLAGGSFVVTWQDYAGTGGDASGAGILSQIYSAAGVALGGVVRVNTRTSGDQTQPVVTSLAGGGYVVTWMDSNAIDPLTGQPGAVLKAQLFDAGGAKIGGEIAVDAEVQSDQALPVVTGLSTGGFVVAWQDSNPASGEPATLIRAQQFDATGAALGASLVVSGSGAGERDFPSIASLPNGGFVVTWQHFVSPTNSEIKAQFYDGAGAKVGGEVLVNTVSADYQERPVISSLLGGGFVIAWSDGSGLGGDADGTGIKAQQFSYGPYKLIIGTPAVDTLTGTTADDHLMGLGSNDTLSGLGGNDLLDGGTGNDTMIGGLGDDIYVVDAAGDVVTELAGQGTDTVQTTLASYTLGSTLENLTFTDNAAHTGNGNALNNVLTGGGGADILNGGSGADRMVGGLGNDTYYVDNAGDTVVEGAGGGTDTVFIAISWTLAANVENLSLSGTAAINGTGNTDANALTGNSAANVLTGLGGNDTLNGGAGNDTMIGGLGDDTFVVDAAGDVVTELAGEGSDTVQTTLASYTLAANVERLTFTNGAAHAGIGNALANVITGNTGNDVLDGGAGADTLIGGTGNDSYVIDNAGDVVTELAAQGTDLVTASASYVLAANIENLTLSGTAAINGTGNTDANVLTGNSGANVLTGLGGNDTLNGGSGNDTLIGGQGDDTYVVDAAGDVVTELSGEGTDTVQTALASFTLGSAVENLTFTNSAAHTGIGNALANVITGNTGNDVLDGAAGADTLIGGSGNDSYVVDNALDVVTEAAGGGTDLVTASLTWTLALNVENLTLSGSAAINGTGNTLDNVIIGTSGNNVLSGLDGNDTLTGGLGNDTLLGGIGNDRLAGGSGNDTLSGGTGTDTFVFDSAPNAATNLDTLQDFTSGSDKLSFSRAVFTGFAATGAMSVDAFWSGAGVNAAHDATDRFIYNTTTGALWYDADGTGATAAVQVALLTGAPALAFSDFLIAA